METFIIAGLGNPRQRFEGTRHNSGFEAAECLSRKTDIPINREGFQAMYGSGFFGGKKFILLKPQTFMNLSGNSLKEAADYYGIQPDHIIVMFDDVNFPCGRLRIRGGGSAGGHNGIKSIISALDSEDFPRVRIGVGGNQGQEDLKDHVLSRFRGHDKEVMDLAFEAAAEAALCIAREGVTEAMNRFNGLELDPVKAEQQRLEAQEKAERRARYLAEKKLKAQPEQEAGREAEAQPGPEPQQ